MTYFGWQMDSDDVSKEVSVALRRYIEKHGQPPTILLEISHEIEKKDVILPKGMDIRIKHIHVPANIIYIASLSDSKI